MEEAYDVRAVEARLAQMEHARRLRVMRKGREGVDGPTGTLGTQTVSGFELSAVESMSESEEDGDDANTSSEEEGHARNKQKKKLRDSLDLSMSMSMAAMPLKSTKVPLKQSKPMPSHAKEERRGTKECLEREENSNKQPPPGQPVISAPAATQMLETSDLWAGKLVQRRRELERHATSAISNEEIKQHNMSKDGFVKHTLVHESAQSKIQSGCNPSVGISASPTRQEIKPVGVNAPGNTGERRQEVALKPTPTALQGTKVDAKPTEPQTFQYRHLQAPKVSVPPVHRVNTAGQEQVAAHSRQDIGQREAQKSIVPTSEQTKLGSSKSWSSESVSNSAPLQRAPALIVPVKAPIAMVFPMNTSRPASNAAAITRPGHPRTNQPPTCPSQPILTDKTEPEDDIIDDLLSAEERKLRQSLDKLNSRLNNISRAATKTIRDNNQAKEKGVIMQKTAGAVSASTREQSEPADDKTMRNASYGGGAHVRLHQPTSPTTRASNLKRTELSGGVYKARVRTGGGAGAQESSGDHESKHKVVVKKDLAHLLF